MTITIQLPPGAEENLSAQAKARGLSLEAFLQAVIASLAIANVSHPSAIETGDVDRTVDDIFDTVQLQPGIGDGAMHCENWYR